MKYFITYHAVERLKERFSLLYNKYPELKNWKREDGLKSIKPLFDKWVNQSEENRSYLNNSSYMINLYDKYGFDLEYCFLEHKAENILFIMTKTRSESNYRLVTLMPTDFRPSIKNVKYNTKVKKEDKHAKKIMEWYENMMPKTGLLPVLSDSNKFNIGQLDCSETVKKLLITMVNENKTTVLERISNAKTLHKTVVDDLEYEFLYGKTSNGTREISLQAIRELSDAEKNQKYWQTYLTEDLKKDLLRLVHNNLTRVEKISNTKSLHEVEWEGIHYNFLYSKVSNGDRMITFQKEPCLVKEFNNEATVTRKKNKL